MEIKNKKALFDYEVLEKYIAGIVLTGTEIKSIRGGKASLVDSYCIISNKEIFLKNSYIAPFELGTFNNHEERRLRKLLLNKQEIRNSRFWGDFKVLVYQLSSQYRDFFLEQKILSDNDCSRMRDAELITSMLILLLEGIANESPKYIDGIYGKYDRDFTQRETVECQFVSTMTIIQEIYDYFNRAYGCFGNKNYFFTLYCVIVNQMYGIKNATLPRNIKYSSDNIYSNVLLLKNAFSQFVLDYEKNIDDKNNVYGLYSEYSEFANNHKTRTTSKNERESRIKFLNNAIGAESTNDNE